MQSVVENRGALLAGQAEAAPPTRKRRMRHSAGTASVLRQNKAS
jgi:hypothetical protein